MTTGTPCPICNAELPAGATESEACAEVRLRGDEPIVATSGTKSGLAIDELIAKGGTRGGIIDDELLARSGKSGGLAGDDTELA